MNCFWLKVLVWNIDWFVPKCGMREEALRRSYVIPITGNNDLSLIFTCAVNLTLTFLLVPVLKLLGSCLVFMDVDHEVSLGSE